MKFIMTAPLARLSLFSSCSKGLVCSLLLSSSAIGVQAQMVTALSETYAVPHVIDGESLPILFDFSSAVVRPDALIFNTTLSLEFTKAPDLSDDQPFYSEIGFILRSLDSSFNVISQIRLVDTGTFNDGEFGSFFSGTLTFDDNASSAINDNPDTLTPGLFRPLDPLATFNGIYSIPFWQLLIDDTSVQNPILFRSATLTVFTAVPEPSSIALLGAGLLGIVSFIRQWRRRSPA